MTSELLDRANNLSSYSVSWWQVKKSVMLTVDCKPDRMVKQAAAKNKTLYSTFYSYMPAYNITLGYLKKEEKIDLRLNTF